MRSTPRSSTLPETTHILLPRIRPRDWEPVFPWAIWQSGYENDQTIESIVGGVAAGTAYILYPNWGQCTGHDLGENPWICHTLSKWFGPKVPSYGFKDAQRVLRIWIQSFHPLLLIPSKQVNTPAPVPSGKKRITWNEQRIRIFLLRNFSIETLQSPSITMRAIPREDISPF